MNIKRDKLTDALEDFWGRGANTSIPAAQVDNTPQDIVETVPMDAQPQISREVEMVASIQPRQMEGGGKSIKDMVQEAIKNKQDRVRTQPTAYPQPQAVYTQPQTPMTPQQPQPKQDFFSGFDSKISQSFGGGMNLGGPMSPAPVNKLDAQFQSGFSGMPMGGGAFGLGFGPRPRGEDPRLARRANLALRDYERQLSLNRMARAEDIAIARSQQLQRARTGREIATSIAEQRKQSAFKTGLPVYENWLDPWFGGKKKGYLKDPDTGKYIRGPQGRLYETTESTPGFFGIMGSGVGTIFEGGKQAYKRGYSAYKGAGGFSGLKTDLDYMTSEEGKELRKKIKTAKKEKGLKERLEQDEGELSELILDQELRKGFPTVSYGKEPSYSSLSDLGNVDEKTEMFVDETYPDNKKNWGNDVGENFIDKDQTTLIEPEVDVEDLQAAMIDQEYDEARRDAFETMPIDDFNDQDRIEDEYSDGKMYIGYSDSFKPMKEMEDDE